MEDKTNDIFREATITRDGEEASSSEKPGSENEPELLIFGEGDNALAKNKGVRYKKPKAGLYVIAGLVGVLIGVLVTLFFVNNISGGLSNLRLIKAMGKYDCSVISELLQEIDMKHYGETPSSQELVDAAAHGLVNGMGDPYASYFTAKEYSDYTSSFNGNYYGIGVLIYNPDGNGALIRRVYENSFAEQAGLLPGDRIVKVDGADTRSVTGNEIVSMIKGDEGSTVEITYLRGDKEYTVTVTRGYVYIKRVDYFVLDSGAGYLYLSSFSGYAEEEFRAALDDFKSKGIKDVVIDLRDNPGGSLTMVVNICDMLLPECVVCSMQGKTTDGTEYFRSDASMYDFNFVVLVNEYSASASEIFAGAMQDNGRAKIIGTQTYGKGVVQTTFELENGHGWLKLTTDAYFTPNGTNLGGTGITPDIIVELPEDMRNYDMFSIYSEMRDRDTQLQAALEELSK